MRVRRSHSACSNWYLPTGLTMPRQRYPIGEVSVGSLTFRRQGADVLGYIAYRYADSSHQGTLDISLSSTIGDLTDPVHHQPMHRQALVLTLNRT